VVVAGLSSIIDQDQGLVSAYEIPEMFYKKKEIERKPMKNIK
jgi:hypothetical protein